MNYPCSETSTGNPQQGQEKALQLAKARRAVSRLLLFWNRFAI